MFASVSGARPHFTRVVLAAFVRQRTTALVGVRSWRYGARTSASGVAAVTRSEASKLMSELVAPL